VSRPRCLELVRGLDLSRGSRNTSTHSRITLTTKQYIIDTYAWVEYLIGSKEGEKAKKYIESGLAYTPSIVLTELRRWYLKELETGRRREAEMQIHFDFVDSSTQVTALDSYLALKAGEVDFMMKKRKKNWPLADSIILAAARARSAYVVSGDPHFEDLEDCIFIGKAHE
jgi:predicted nucleic acid-binding protein